MSLQSNKAVILLGAQNTNNLTVSRELADMGITLLRQVPSDARIISIPLRNQPFYHFYIGNLPIYLKSWIENTSVDASLPGYPVKIPLAKTVPLKPPSVIIGWRVPVADEVKQDIITNHGGVPVMAQGNRPALSIQKATLAEYAGLRDYKPDPIFPSIDDHFNFSCYIPMITSVRLLSGIIALNHYSAWADEEHMRNYILDLEKLPDEDEAMPAEGESMYLPRSMILPDPFAEAKEENDAEILINTLGLRAKGVKHAFDSEQYSCCITSLEDIPAEDGLYAPYISSLAMWDPRAVPDFINDFCLSSLGESTAEIKEEMEDIRRAWGILSKTEWGKAMSHIAVMLRASLKAQARCLPVFSEDTYKGCIISGYGYEISVNGRTFAPVPQDELHETIKKADTHSMALHKVIGLISTSQEERVLMERRINSSARLREELLRAEMREIDSTELARYTRLLKFPDEKFWAINVNSLTRAFDLITNVNMSLEGLPIHHSQMRSLNRNHVVWSCFGGMAPTFLIPGGRIIDLTSELKIAITRNVKGKASQTESAFSKVACRNVPLDKALRDLDRILEEKKIQSPFAQPNVRRSQPNQDRFFSGDQGIQIVAGLRKICMISEVSTSNKRRMNAPPDEEPSKKRAYRDVF